MEYNAFIKKWYCGRIYNNEGKVNKTLWSKMLIKWFMQRDPKFLKELYTMKKMPGMRLI